MASVNKAILLGNVGSDPKMTALQSGKVAQFSLATSKRYTDRSGGQRDETTWHNIVVYGKPAEVAEKYVHKGSQVFIEGEFRNRSFTGNDGITRYVSEVVAQSLQLLGPKPQQQPAQAPAPVQPQTQQPASGVAQQAPPDDDLPFRQSPEV